MVDNQTVEMTNSSFKFLHLSFFIDVSSFKFVGQF